jgi:hypothetical protein
MSATVDASDLDVIVLMEAMWQRAPMAGFFSNFGVSAPAFSADSARAELVRNNGRVDYCCGRPIKTNFSNMAAINPRGFDRDAGGYDSNNSGALARIVEQLRQRAKK